MEVFNALRRIKRQFGDEYNVVINDQDIYDWMYDAELDIIRATSDNDLTISVPIVNFPLQVPDRVNIKRLSIGGKALTNIALSQLDLTRSYSSSSGDSAYWYYQGGLVYLWPVSENTTSNVEVTYARTPAQMTVVAPYLNFVQPPSGMPMYATAPSDEDWFYSGSVNIAMELSIDNIQRLFNIITCGTGVVAAGLHFSISFSSSSPRSLLLTVSNGTVLKTFNLTFKQDIIPGENFKFRITYDQSYGTAYLYKINLFTGQEILQDTKSINEYFIKQSTADASLVIGNSTASGVHFGNAPIMKIRSIELRSTNNSTAIVFFFDGMNDLGNLFGPVPSFTASSGHAMTVTGPLITPASNQFTVPEVFHEDVVKYCLAKAHTKNQNFRAAEAEMEQYDRRVSTRRNEAQAPETALYKIPDPADYDEYEY